MRYSALGASLLGNVLAGNGIIRKDKKATGAGQKC